MQLYYILAAATLASYYVIQFFGGFKKLLVKLIKFGPYKSIYMEGQGTLPTLRI